MHVLFKVILLLSRFGCDTILTRFRRDVCEIIRCKCLLMIFIITALLLRFDIVLARLGFVIVRVFFRIVIVRIRFEIVIITFTALQSA